MLTAAEVAHQLGVSARMVYDPASRGAIASHEPG